MSPEQVRGKEVAPASDIYSYAVILYCIFTGRLPFDGEGHTIMMKHASEEPPAPRSLNQFLPEATAAALLTGLAKNPEARPQNALEMVEAILRGLGDRMRLSYAAVLRGRSAPDEQFIKELWLDDAPHDAANDRGRGVTGKIPSAKAGDQPPSPDATSADVGLGRIFLAGKGGRATTAGEKLRAAGYRVKTFERGGDAIDAMLKKPPQLLLVFDELEDVSGPMLCRIMQAHPLSETMPVLFVGERDRLGMSRQGAHGLLQTMSPDEPPERIVEDVNLLFRRLRDVPTKPFEGMDQARSSSTPLISFLTRLDASLRHEETSKILTRAVVRGESIGAIFDDLRDLLLPSYQFRHQVCAVLPDNPGEQGKILVDLAHPTDPIAERNFLAPISKAIRAAARDHKDLPDRFEAVFTKAPAAPDTSSEQTAVSMGEQYWLVPIEDGPRLFGLWGVAYRGDAPVGDAIEVLSHAAPHGYAALSASWRRGQLDTSRDIDEITGVWRRPRIFEYFELSLRSTPAYEEPFCLMLLDIDKLDNYNETFGLEGGDEVLRKIGELIRRSCTGMFRAGRVGGDEFLLVMPNMTSGDAMKFGKQLLDNINRLSMTQWANPIQPTACAGLAFRAMEEKTSAYLMRAARNGLKAAKAAGPGKIRAMG
jgi:diguanylate cyclase (GGDEF)-like protein